MWTLGTMLTRRSVGYRRGNPRVDLLCRVLGGQGAGRASGVHARTPAHRVTSEGVFAAAEGSYEPAFHEVKDRIRVGFSKEVPEAGAAQDEARLTVEQRGFRKYPEVDLFGTEGVVTSEVDPLKHWLGSGCASSHIHREGQSGFGAWVRRV